MSSPIFSSNDGLLRYSQSTGVKEIRLKYSDFLQYMSTFVLLCFSGMHGFGLGEGERMGWKVDPYHYILLRFEIRAIFSVNTSFGIVIITPQEARYV